MEGFYKETNEGWQYAQDAVYAPNYTLLKADKDTLELPIDGWDWYDTSPIPVVVDSKKEELKEWLNAMTPSERESLLSGVTPQEPSNEP